MSDDDELGEGEVVVVVGGVHPEWLGWKWWCCSVQRDGFWLVFTDSQLPSNI